MLDCNGRIGNYSQGVRTFAWWSSCLLLPEPDLDVLRALLLRRRPAVSSPLSAPAWNAHAVPGDPSHVRDQHCIWNRVSLALIALASSMSGLARAFVARTVPHLMLNCRQFWRKSFSGLAATSPRWRVSMFAGSSCARFWLLWLLGAGGVVMPTHVAHTTRAMDGAYGLDGYKDYLC
jgi:hypothetical protein